MATFTIKLVCEAGSGPLGEGPFERAEELIDVDAPTLWDAYRSATRKMTISPMGRLLVGYDAETGERVEAPDEPRELRAAQFAVDGLEGTFEGYTMGEMWNGWAVPYFPLEEAQRIIAEYAAQPPSLDGQTRGEYDPDRDVIRLYDPSADEWDEIGSVDLDGHTLYPVGSCLWTWEEKVNGAL
jgi:hypothetical protein